jgi:c-di-GMP-related signal transduction protein
MQLFMGRQPILDQQFQTFGYELLFRSGSVNSFDGKDPAAATAAVISNTFFSLGADKVLGSRKAFVNFPRELLVAKEPPGLPPESVVIEVLETVEPDREVIEACHRLKAAGYQLALDDFVRRPASEPLIEIADFIKVDFRATTWVDRRSMGEEFAARGIRMVAEKVETTADVESARSMGYRYFQGFFFARPEILAAREIPVCKINALRLMRALHQPELDFAELEQLIRRDVSIAHKLLRFVNSAAFACAERVDSILHALALLGETGVRKWVALAAMPNLATDKVPELVRMSVYRGRFCELVAERTDFRAQASECFLMGLFSLLDVMMSRPLRALLPELGLRESVCAALCGEAVPGNRFGDVYDLCIACEAANTAAIERNAEVLGLPWHTVARLYCDAMSWADSVRLDERR